ncbi:hypothetical protein [Micromonospora sp. LOL_021]|uniref:hypothetical protein n=1 Tax=Micromonospora sp. LOL_021 TaxID=3345417 RepID=UPI003A8AB33B
MVETRSTRTLPQPCAASVSPWTSPSSDPATPLAVDPVPTSASLPEAVVLCYRYLHGALRATIPADQLGQPAAARFHPDGAHATTTAQPKR